MTGFVAGLPMDGSEQAEECLLLLPMLKTIGFGKISLFSVFDKDQRPQERRDGRYADAEWGPQFLEQYLKEQGEQIQGLGFDVETKVLTGKVGDTVVKEINESGVDLVLVATRGRTGLARVRYGSVAERIIKDSSCPRFVIGPNVDIYFEDYSLKRILVPLDGSPMAEQSIPLAKYLAELTHAEIDLIRSVSSAALPTDAMVTAIDVISPMVDGAQSYLNEIAGRFPGIKVTASVVTGGPAASILAHLKEHPVDVVIMASNGRTGISRIALGSVTEEVLQGPDPVIVFEPNEDRGALFAAARAASQ